MASKRPTVSKSKESHNRDNYHDYLQASLEVECIDWQEDDNTPQEVTTEATVVPACINKDDCTTDCKQRKLSQKKCTTSCKCCSFDKNTIGSDRKITRRNLLDGSKSCSDCENNVQDSTDPFSSLIDEIILNIFSHLSHFTLTRCSQVCRKWRKLSYDKSLWKQANLDSCKFTQEGVLGVILHRRVTVLRLSKAEILAPIFSDNMTDTYTSQTSDDDADDDIDGDLSLTHLDCSMSKFCDDTLSDLLYKCTELKNLSLEGAKVDQAVISGITMNRHLEVLNLALTVGLNLSSVDILTRQCKCMTSLNLSWTNQTRDCIRYISRCKRLKCLNLSGLRGGIDRKCMEILVKSCKQIVELDLSDVNLQIGSLKLIADELTRLQKLSISRCTAVRSEQLLDLEHLRSLSHLNLFGFSNSVALEQFSEKRPDIHINKDRFSPIARPILATSYEGRLWEQYVGFII